MTRPENNQTEFQDPLENYDSPTYDDSIEQALVEEPVTSIQSRPYASVSPDIRVADAIKRLVEDEIACLLVEDEGRLVGVFSDRDILDKVALEFDDMKDRPVKDVMSPDPVYVFDTDSSAAALTVMAVSGYRHVPVVDLDQKLIGIISPQRVTRFLREHAG
ncbi:MAG: CBS domain-containing protein [Planctomycetaceae bacterium]|jgi:CBS domain-containing protein|nr:CBS domain-containing protein [Planctomycetaceae bacterium]MBT6153903.1 CBS domain-containing protein [Planctomycetaceae bacterium]MBT6486626.1 CBS domain-containing protein [Planctomycetaceae bacterium]MBT6496824.1 CBS domain-containing protein [Planctomycetaceae bacterium]